MEILLWIGVALVVLFVVGVFVVISLPSQTLTRLEESFVKKSEAKRQK